MFPVINFPENQASSTRGKSYLYDFNKGDFTVVDGKLVEIDELESVKVWIEKILRTEKFKFRVYENGERDQYGITLMDFIASGYPYDFVTVEIEREVREALLRNSEITDTHSYSFYREKRTLVCEFVANTVYGEVEMVVRV